MILRIFLDDFLRDEKGVMRASRLMNHGKKRQKDS